MDTNKKAVSDAGNTTDSMTKSSIDSVAQQGSEVNTLIRVDLMKNKVETTVQGDISDILSAFCALADTISKSVPHRLMCATMTTALDYAGINPLELAALKAKAKERERHVE